MKKANTRNGVKKVKDANAVYHATDYLGKSQLNKMALSPAHFKANLDNPPAQTKTFALGSAFHCIVLEPELFDTEFFVMPSGVDGRTKAGKELIQTAAENNQTVITADEYETICGMRDAVMSDPYARLLLSGEKETSYYWTDKETGVKVKCRPDCRTYLSKENAVIIDLKSTESAQFDTFVRDCFKYGYDLQVAQYTEGVEKYYGKPHKFVFIAVEKKPPYAVNIIDFADVFIGDEQAIMRGYDKLRTYLGMVAECRFTDNWYDYRGSTEVEGTSAIPDWLIEEAKKRKCKKQSTK